MPSARCAARPLPRPAPACREGRNPLPRIAAHEVRVPAPVRFASPWQSESSTWKRWNPMPEAAPQAALRTRWRWNWHRWPFRRRPPSAPRRSPHLRPALLPGRPPDRRSVRTSNPKQLPCSPLDSQGPIRPERTDRIHTVGMFRDTEGQLRTFVIFWVTFVLRCGFRRAHYRLSQVPRRRSASSMSAAGPAKDSRTKELPTTVSKSTPGAIATPVSASNFSQNRSESSVKSETSA